MGVRRVGTGLLFVTVGRIRTISPDCPRRGFMGVRRVTVGRVRKISPDCLWAFGEWGQACLRDGWTGS